MKYLKLILGITVLMAVVTSTQAQSWLTNGLVAYYPFNGNPNDSSGNGNHGKIVGNVTNAADRFGFPSSAYHFNGILSDIVVTNSVFNIGQTGYTVSGWFCSDDVTKVRQCVFNTIPHTGIGLIFNHSYAPGYAQCFIGPANAFWTVQAVHGPKNDYQTNRWYHLVFAKNGTAYTLYINGQVDTQTTVSQSSAYNYNVGYRFGSIDSLGYEVFKGRLDDFRIYNRALATNEVAQLYAIESAPIINIQKAVYITSSNLLAGTNYQVQVSSDLLNWTNSGATFTATNSTWRTTNYWDVDNWNQLYLRLLRQ